MKNILNVTILLIVFTSCFPEGDLGDETNTTLINRSGHNLEIQIFNNGAFRSSTFINNNIELELGGGSGEPGGPIGPWIRPLIDADSIWVIYYEKASIMHTKDENSVVSRSLMLESSYEGSKVKDGLYEFTYTFTPEDFEEALEFGD